MTLVEVDSLEIVVIVDNELDVMSPPPPDTVQATGLMGNIALESPYDLHHRGDAFKGASHGQYLLLCPWTFSDDCGMLRAIQMIRDAQAANGRSGQDLVVDLHEARPDYRGFSIGSEIISLEADPTFEEIEDAGAKVEKTTSPHTVLDGMFLISGEIPRITEYETGLAHAVRFEKSTGQWDKDEIIADERLLACNLKGKGLVIFTGCSHAGVVNASRHAVDLAGKNIPAYAIFGGYHLAGSEAAQIEATVKDLKALNPKILLPGHCSGWRVKYEIEKEMPGRLVPPSVGAKLTF
ncbi:hypothetical protein CIHG_07691 [Coccidioides immitis H538.4]|uniref:MBL fold metallo-hydrolase n=1 Tax=Coccidioides immitis H538.4 TaxID=396776 RepID=A0A0J8UQZ8_COCIT|nr:hypothetical protein CIHG_07691 [Coccidioides immitis H538.4]